VGTVEEMFPAFTPKTMKQLSEDSGASESILWQFINDGELSWPIQIERNKWVYGPMTYKAILEIAKELIDQNRWRLGDG